MGAVVRYVGKIAAAGEITVGMQSYEADHPLLAYRQQIPSFL